MKQFNLEEYLKNPSRKVVTRDGHPVRIICTDKENAYPVIALVKILYCEITIECTANGKYEQNNETKWDIFFAPEKHEGWINIYRDTILSGAYYKYIYPSEEDAKENACSGAIATIKIEWEE